MSLYLERAIGQVLHDYGDERISHFTHGPSQESKYIIGGGDEYLVLQGASSARLYLVDFTSMREKQRVALLKQWYVETAFLR